MFRVETGRSLTREARRFEQHVMTTHNHQDWDPRASEVLAEPIAAYDRMRQHCPVAHSDYLHQSVFRHADVMDILLDPETFSNDASRHVSVPNSMDPPEHTAYRQAIAPYFNAARINEFEPICRRICERLTANLARDAPIEIMAALGYPLALQAQCAFLGWPDSMHEPLLQWIHKKNTATLSGNKHATAAVAQEFDATIRALLQQRRDAGQQAPNDATSRLMHETVNGKRLTEEEIVSILRN